MNGADLFTGFRPSDARFENMHVLADYIEQTQRLVTELAEASARTERILEAAARLNNGGAVMFRNASVEMGEHQEKLSATLKDVSGQITVLLERWLIDTRAAVQAPITALDEKTTELLEATDKVEAERKAAMHERMALVDAKAKLAAYETEHKTRLDAHKAAYETALDAYVLTCLATIDTAKTNALAGRRFFERVVGLWKDPEIMLLLPKPPARPKSG